MTTKPTTRARHDDLDGFETALLHQLRDVASAPAAPTAPRWRTPTAAAAAAAAAIAGVLVLSPTPAYAVSEDSNGRVTVEVNRLEGPRALEAALARIGVNAQVTYLAPGRACAPGRFLDATPRGALLSVGADSFAVTLPAGAVRAGQTFVLSASVRPMPEIDGFQATVDFGVADGPVAPCEEVSARAVREG